MPTNRPTQLGMVGLGRMGANLVHRLVRDGHNCVVYDVNVDAEKQLATLAAAELVSEVLSGVGTTVRRSTHGGI